MSLHNFKNSKKRLDVFYAEEAKQIERARVVLSKEHGREITFDEAKEVVRGLTSYYELLADGRRITRAGLDNYVS